MGDSRIGVIAASLARLSSRKRRNATPSPARRASNCLTMRATSCVASIWTAGAPRWPCSSRYMGSSLASSAWSCSEWPVVRTISSSTYGIMKNVGPQSQWNPSWLRRRVRPPTRSCASYTVTCRPLAASRSAAARPPGPAPTMAIERSVDSEALAITERASGESGARIHESTPWWGAKGRFDACDSSRGRPKHDPLDGAGSGSRL